MAIRPNCVTTAALIGLDVAKAYRGEIPWGCLLSPNRKSHLPGLPVVRQAIFRMTRRKRALGGKKSKPGTIERHVAGTDAGVWNGRC